MRLAEQRFSPSRNQDKKPQAESACLLPSSIISAAAEDFDGDLDVLSASYFDNKIAWYDNDGSQNFTAHTISTAADGGAERVCGGRG